MWKSIRNRVHGFIKLISKICRFAKLPNAFSESARGFNSYRIPELPKHMRLQHVRRTLGCTDLPQHKIFGKNAALGIVDAILMDEFLQAVNVGIYRDSHIEWRRISLDETPKRDIGGGPDDVSSLWPVRCRGACDPCGALAKLAFLLHVRCHCHSTL